MYNNAFFITIEFIIIEYRSCVVGSVFLVCVMLANRCYLQKNEVFVNVFLKVVVTFDGSCVVGFTNRRDDLQVVAPR
jgi:hypothetical protein